MIYFMLFLLIGLVVGVIAVASNPSPYFAALGLVIVSGVGCGMMISHGGPFLSLILFLIYLGGMLVVFAYSAALAAEQYPESWVSESVVFYSCGYSLGVVFVMGLFADKWSKYSWVPSDELYEFSVFRGDMLGVGVMYGPGGAMLIIGAWVLLLTLFVVLELTRGLGRGALRVV